jgi:tol-pal system protein YbgF
VKREFEHRQAQLDYLEEGVAQLDSLERVELDRLSELNADLHARLSGLEERIQILEAKVEEGQSRLLAAYERRGAQPETTEVNLAQLYSTAYLDLHRGDYELSIQGFKKFLELAPQSDLADNAQYWIGEAFYDQRRYQEAIAEFELVLTNYPSQDKVPAALYKIGLAYQGLGNRSLAREYLKKVVEGYPLSPEAKLAQERLGELK